MTTVEVSLQSYLAYLTADCKNNLMTFRFGVSQGSTRGHLLLISRLLSAKRYNLSFGGKVLLVIAPIPIIIMPFLVFGLCFIFYFRCPVPQCKILARPSFCLAIPPHFYYLQLPYISRKDSNEAVPHLRLKWSSLTHWTIICMHSYFLSASDVLCMWALSLAIINPRSLSFNRINRPAHKQNELLMIH